MREVSLSKQKPLTVKNYIKFLIENEKRDRKIGFP